MSEAQTKAERPAKAAENLAAVGIGVADLARAEDFYTRVLGMQVQQRIDLPYMKEIVVGHAGRTAVVLMHWIDGSARTYANNPVKLVFYVPDARGVIEKIRAEGLAIDLEPEPNAAFGGAIIGLARDPDGYVVEFIQTPKR